MGLVLAARNAMASERDAWSRERKPGLGGVSWQASVSCVICTTPSPNGSLL